MSGGRGGGKPAGRGPGARLQGRLLARPRDLPREGGPLEPRVRRHSGSLGTPRQLRGLGFLVGVPPRLLFSLRGAGDGGGPPAPTSPAARRWRPPTVLCEGFGSSRGGWRVWAKRTFHFWPYLPGVPTKRVTKASSLTLRTVAGLSRTKTNTSANKYQKKKAPGGHYESGPDSRASPVPFHRDGTGDDGRGRRGGGGGDDLKKNKGPSSGPAAASGSEKNNGNIVKKTGAPFLLSLPQILRGAGGRPSFDSKVPSLLLKRERAGP
jgi:hypothetical protein